VGADENAGRRMIQFTIFGEPASLKNSRELVFMNRWSPKKQANVKMPASVKSEKALKYESDAVLQIPANCKQMLQGRVRVTARIYYASERPDLDEAIILDIMQAKYEKKVEGVERKLIRRGVYVNDRQVREKHIYWDYDPKNPRAEIKVELIDQELSLDIASA
jgi:hypothetical protein